MANCPLGILCFILAVSGTNCFTFDDHQSLPKYKRNMMDSWSDIHKYNPSFHHLSPLDWRIFQFEQKIRDILKDKNDQPTYMPEKNQFHRQSFFLNPDGKLFGKKQLFYSKSPYMISSLSISNGEIKHMENLKNDNIVSTPKKAILNSRMIKDEYIATNSDLHLSNRVSLTNDVSKKSDAQNFTQSGQENGNSKTSKSFRSSETAKNARVTDIKASSQGFEEFSQGIKIANAQSAANSENSTKTESGTFPTSEPVSSTSDKTSIVGENHTEENREVIQQKINDLSTASEEKTKVTFPEILNSRTKPNNSDSSLATDTDSVASNEATPDTNTNAETTNFKSTATSPVKTPTTQPDSITSSTLSPMTDTEFKTQYSATETTNSASSPITDMGPNIANSESISANSISSLPTDKDLEAIRDESRTIRQKSTSAINTSSRAKYSEITTANSAASSHFTDSTRVNPDKALTAVQTEKESKSVKDYLTSNSGGNKYNDRQPTVSILSSSKIEINTDISSSTSSDLIKIFTKEEKHIIYNNLNYPKLPELTDLEKHEHLIRISSIHTVKIVVSAVFIAIAIVATAVLTIYFIKVKRGDVQYDQLTLLP